MSSTAPVSILDEAGQCIEFRTLCGVNSSTLYLILVGDHKQLSPVVRETPGFEEGSGISALERFALLGLPMTMLTIQYRMFPSITRLPNDLFYNGKLINGVKEGRPPAGFDWPRGQASVFLNVEGQEQLEENSTSYSNAMEINCVMEVVCALLAAKNACTDIGVLSFYKTQQVQLEKKLASLKVVCGTVDALQGQEKEIMVLTCVRSNNNGAYGFQDKKRINVAMTRAKKGLIIIGSSSTLQNCPAWHSIILGLRQVHAYREH